MFHPVPRVDRWEPLLAAILALVIAAAVLAAALFTL